MKCRTLRISWKDKVTNIAVRTVGYYSSLNTKIDLGGACGEGSTQLDKCCIGVETHEQKHMKTDLNTG